ncbi:hypothetical protein D3C83_100660 [compost metagenome]
MRLRAIRADAEDDGVLLRDFRVRIAEGAGLLGAARGVVLWVEVQDYALASQIAQLHGLTAVANRFEVRRRISNLEFRHLSPAS